jgi:predicted amino acid-binding ACT domain protein
MIVIALAQLHIQILDVGQEIVHASAHGAMQLVRLQIQILEPCQ